MTRITTQTRLKESPPTPQSDAPLESACGGFSISPNGHRLRFADFSCERSILIAVAGNDELDRFRGRDSAVSLRDRMIRFRRPWARFLSEL